MATDTVQWPHRRHCFGRGERRGSSADGLGRLLLRDGGASGVMCSYNAVNGEPVCTSGLLNATLRGALGFEGFVATDCGAIDDAVEIHKAFDTEKAGAVVASVLAVLP